MSFIDKCEKRLYEQELMDLPPAQETLAQRFAAYDAKYPYIYIAIRNHAERLIHSGVRYLSMKGLFEAMRGHIGGGVKLNNSYTSFYTDKLIADCPYMAEYFHRRARAERKMKRVYA